MQRPLILRQGPVRLEGGVGDGAVEHPRASLGVDREGPQRLDPVAPEIDTQRVAESWVDVDEAAAHGVLAAAADLLDAFIAKRRKALDDSVERDLIAGGQGDRVRLPVERQEALRQRDRLGDYDASMGERRERLLALADDMRSGSHVGAVEHAASGKHRHGSIEVQGEVGGQSGRRLSVGRDDQPPGGVDRRKRPGEQVRGEEARGVRGPSAAQSRNRRLERLALQKVVPEHVPA